MEREVDELRASRRRLVLAADADRRSVERALHEGVQQQLIALAVKVQLARQLTSTDVAAAESLLDEMGSDVQQAIDDLRQLAQRIHSPLLEAGGLAAALRSAAASSGGQGSIDIAPDFSYPTELAGTVYACCLEALDGGMTIAVRNEDDTLLFEVLEDADQLEAVERIRDRVDAVGGRLIIEPHST